MATPHSSNVSNSNSSFRGRGGYGGSFGKKPWRGGRNFRGRGNWNNNKSNSSQNKHRTSQQSIKTMLPLVHCPYKGWQLYMTQGYKENSEIVKIVKIFEEYVKRNESLLSGVNSKNAFTISVKDLLEDSIIKENLPDLADIIVNSPTKIISALGLAAHQILSEELEISIREEAAVALASQDGTLSPAAIEANLPQTNLPIIHPRLLNLNKLTSLKNLKANYYGKLVSIKGTVVRVGSVKPLCRQMAFSCITCDTVLSTTQDEGKYTLPTSCTEDSCHSRSFTPLRSHKLTRTVDFQTIRLQEMINDDQREGGRIPRTIECEVTEDLADTCVPGDVVIITGIVKINQNDDARKTKADKSTYLLYIDAVSVVNCKTGNNCPSIASGIEFSVKDYYAIEKIQSEMDLFKLLVASLCPAIYGHEMVKAGLLLCMFGGCSKSASHAVPVRGEPHVLVVGDPGLGKSQMLQACCNVAPRGVYVCGNTTTTSGLTVTLSKEGGGDYALEGGALVLADQGICCIDEFDKMANQHQALLEAMEQQSISIAKAGIVCSLPARTSILAAANPVGGHYNKSKTVSENIKMGSALLSRFDLVFILLDKPDEELDSLLSEHVMALHSKRQKVSTSCSGVRVSRQDFLNTSAAEDEMVKPLSESLKYSNHNDVDRIPHELVRKYICYARKYVHPKLTPPAAKVLQQFYLELRSKLQNSDSTSITTRQLESLIRLSEAKARCELREDVTETDARQVIEIMKFSMIDTYSDEFGLLDFKRSQHGSGTSNRTQMRKFINALQKLSDSMYKSLFTMDELRQLSRQINIQVMDFGEFVAGLNNQGFLLKKGPKIYQLLTAS